MPAEDSPPTLSLPAIARGWAALDLAVTGLMALPLTARWLVDLIYGLSGEASPLDTPEVASLTPLLLFFVGLAGALGVLWALARIRSPITLLVQMDIVGRLWVTGLITWFVLGHGAPVALLAFTVTEVLGSAHQAWAVRQTNSAVLA